MLEMHEDKYLELFLMKCGFNGVQHKQHETDFHFLTWKVFGFFFSSLLIYWLGDSYYYQREKTPSN